MTESLTLSRRALVGAAAVGTIAGLVGARPARANATTSVADPLYLSIRDYESFVTNPNDPQNQWDWTAAIQAAIDENPGRAIFFPDDIEHYTVSSHIALRSDTALVGTGRSTIRFTITPTGDTAIARAGFFRLREQAVQQDPTGAFSHGIRVEGLRFVSVEQQRNCAFLLVNIRGARFERCTFINCGGVFVTHELQMNGSYDPGSASGSSDPAVAAGFSADSTDDLCRDVVFVDNVVDGLTYFVMGIRLNFVDRAVVSGNVCRYASISWWGGGARQEEGGSKANLRRCRNLTIVNNYTSWNNGGIYGNCASAVTVTGNVCEYSIDTAIDMEGCVDYTVDGNIVRYAGNFCYSVFYAGRNAVFSNNVAIQGPAAAGMGDIGPQSGREVFRHISGFDDAGEPEQFSLRGNTFRWDGDSGFGLLRVDNWGEVDVTGNRFENVVVDGLFGNSKHPQAIERNDFVFDNATAADDVYIAVGRQRPGEECRVRENRIVIANGHTNAIPVFVYQPVNGGPTLTRIEGNSISAGCAISIGYSDGRTGSPAQDHRFLVRENTVDGAIQNLSRHATGSAALAESGNLDRALNALSVQANADVARYGSLSFGIDVG